MARFSLFIGVRKGPLYCEERYRTVLRVFGVLILCTQIALQGIGGQTQTTPSPQQRSSAAVKPLTLVGQLRKAVGFLRVGFQKDGAAYVAEGTCFFALYEDKRLGEHAGFVYLVTNRHVAAPGSDQGMQYPIAWMKLRLNLRNSSADEESQEIEIPINARSHWFFPTDDSVDLAVLPFRADPTKYDYKAVPLSLFATEETISTNNISEGDTVLFTGFFYQFPGLKRIQPIVRQGVLALLPNEKMQTTLNRAGQIYLADVHVFEGNSGSPVYVNLSGLRNGVVTARDYPYRLIGVVSGYYIEDTEFNLTISTTVKGILPGNSGIAMIVPAYQLRDLLDIPALKSARDSEAAATVPKNP